MAAITSGWRVTLHPDRAAPFGTCVPFAQGTVNSPKHCLNIPMVSCSAPDIRATCFSPFLSSTSNFWGEDHFSGKEVWASFRPRRVIHAFARPTDLKPYSTDPLVQCIMIGELLGFFRVPAPKAISSQSDPQVIHLGLLPMNFNQLLCFSFLTVTFRRSRGTTTKGTSQNKPVQQYESTNRVLLFLTAIRLDL